MACVATLGVGSGQAGQKEDAVQTTEKQTDETNVQYSEAGYDITPLPRDRVKELASRLTDDERRILLNQGTEPPYCGTLLDNKTEGTYVCKLCGLPLFSSESKFTSGTGWPSFYKPYAQGHVKEIEDRSHGMVRTEIRCARCDGHLGHVFPDGPKPTGLRYCLNSASLDFHAKGTDLPEHSQPVQTETAYFGGGCFWGVEDYFQQLPGVLDAVSGYQGGHVKNPTYRQVCSGETGHAETVKVVFDPSRIGYRQLLQEFFRIHNPTTKNRQGPDIGTQYRSAIYADTDEQLEQARAFVAEQQERGKWSDREITTEVRKAPPFYEAEEYHQDYNDKHGRQCHVPIY